MSKFLIRIFLFLTPFFLGIYIEISIRNNSFKAKSDYIVKNANDIEVLLLGSSQTNKSVNPKFLEFKTAPLANDGNTLNIDYLLFEEYFPKLPNLKVVFFELSYHSLEDLKSNNWNKNHLLLKFYNVNNYGKNPPLSERFLISSSPKEYLKIFFTPQSKLEDNKFNKYGYILNSPSRFKKHKYDPETIKKTSMKEYLKGRHQDENLDYYKINTTLLETAINKCLANNIKIVLLSPPKYYLYNNHLNKIRAERRISFLNKYKNVPNVYIWNFENKYETKTNYFLNEDHLNYEGSKQFTEFLNEKMKKIISN